MQSIDVVGTLRRGWRLLLVMAVVFAIVAVLIPQSSGSSSKHKGTKLHWQAVTIVGAAPPGGSSLVNGGVTPGQLVYYGNTFAVRTQAAIKAKLKVNPFLLGPYMIAQQAATVNSGQGTSTTAPKQKKTNSSGLVELTAFGKTGKDAVNLANAYASALGSYVNGIARQRLAQAAASAGSTTTPVVANTGYQVVVPAYSATHAKGGKSSVTASRKVRLLIGIVLGLLLAAAILLLREVLDRHIRDSDGAFKAFGYPVVIEIPAVEEGGTALVGFTAAAAEAYRRLRTSVAFEHLAEAQGSPDELATFFGRPEDEVSAPAAGSEIGRRQLVLVTSADGEPSRSRVAANLAASYAEGGLSVVVLSTSELPDVPPGGVPVTAPGDVEAQLAPTMLPGVRRLPLERLVGSSGQLATRAPVLLEALRSLADLVVIEAPSLLEVHHAGALSAMVDTVLLVVEVGVTTSDQGAKSGDLLQRLDAPVLGLVLTEVAVAAKTGPAAPATPPPVGGNGHGAPGTVGAAPTVPVGAPEPLAD